MADALAEPVANLQINRLPDFEPPNNLYPALELLFSWICVHARFNTLLTARSFQRINPTVSVCPVQVAEAEAQLGLQLQEAEMDYKYELTATTV